ncbi:MAG TPA: class V aminotransferase, partial [Sphingomicrobium sp.]|nr:class V aminotransferase [Sphingomicrobium sp.]
DGHIEAWNDAARFADRKWDKVMDVIWPAAQAEVAAELGTSSPDAIVFAPNTHELLVRTFASAASERPLRVLTSDGEFHSARRQLARFEEAGKAVVERIPVEPFDSFSDRFLTAARAGSHDVILVSQLLFGSGRIFDEVEQLALLGKPGGPWVVIDGYHAFMAIKEPFGQLAADRAFYLGGGYKYAMAGEGCAFMHAPAGFAERPPITGWFAEFEDLSLPPGSIGYAKDGRRFLGATFDPSGLYRFVAVRKMLAANGLTTGRISQYCSELQRRLLDRIAGATVGKAELLNPIGGGPHARFLAIRSPEAQRWYAELKRENCITDVRADVLRIGFGIYQDEGDVDRLAQLLGGLQ